MPADFTHAPEGYDCPFCRLLGDNTDPLNDQADIVFQDALVSAFISPKWWPNNHGHVIVIPNGHYENIFDLPPECALAIFEASRQIARAMLETYGCQGISTRQHNGPAGNQDVWHYHLHVFPRYPGDQLYLSHAQAIWVTIEERRPYVEKLKRFLASS